MKIAAYHQIDEQLVKMYPELFSAPIILSDPGSEVDHITQEESNCDQEFLYWKGID